ncbi:MAG: bifunctional DNA-formamidopyrimidine glycosylase/DNA-(apurinic or apyrimidinic site) lyase [Acidobacteria bacterium]|nr:bifunctional DNA-formamidopyrimidine glycosylase/DNA-(apurinic or apyrimidinic site) lyase [Acidobacteriota bacterium]
MPELPEVETIARGLDKRVRGDVIDSVWLGSHSEPLKSPAEEISSTLKEKQIRAVRRVGKHIVFDLEQRPPAGEIVPRGTMKGSAKSRARIVPRGTKGNVPRGTISREGDDRNTAQWIVHLGMTGRMLVCAPTDEPAKHTHAVISLASGRELRFVDPRRFGRLSVVSSQEFTGPGSEPLTITPEGFARLFRGRNSPVKAALLNQKLLHGVGNIYADESLFRAGIRPRRLAGRLKRDELMRLHRALQEVLHEAIRTGGSSVSDYVDADGKEGFFQLRHRVYLRTGLPCLKCKTPIKRIVLAGRGTHFCPKCQR